MHLSVYHTGRGSPVEYHCICTKVRLGVGIFLELGLGWAGLDWTSGHMDNGYRYLWVWGFDLGITGVFLFLRSVLCGREKVCV